MKIQINERDMMRILTAAVREIKAEQKREQAATCSEKGYLHEKSNTKKTTEEVGSRDFTGDSGWDDRSRTHGRALDRICDPDQRENQHDGCGG